MGINVSTFSNITAGFSDVGSPVVSGVPDPPTPIELGTTHRRSENKKTLRKYFPGGNICILISGFPISRLQRQVYFSTKLFTLTVIPSEVWRAVAIISCWFRGIYDTSSPILAVRRTAHVNSICAEKLKMQGEIIDLFCRVHCVTNLVTWKII